MSIKPGKRAAKVGLFDGLGQLFDGFFEKR